MGDSKSPLSFILNSAASVSGYCRNYLVPFDGVRNSGQRRFFLCVCVCFVSLRVDKIGMSCHCKGRGNVEAE